MLTEINTQTYNKLIDIKLEDENISQLIERLLTEIVKKHVNKKQNSISLLEQYNSEEYNSEEYNSEEYNLEEYNFIIETLQQHDKVMMLQDLVSIYFQKYKNINKGISAIKTDCYRKVDWLKKLGIIKKENTGLSTGKRIILLK